MKQISLLTFVILLISLMSITYYGNAQEYILQKGTIGENLQKSESTNYQLQLKNKNAIPDGFSQSAVYILNSRPFRPIDKIPPSVPTNVRVGSLDHMSTRITYFPAEDNMGVESYLIYRDDVLIGATPDTFYTDTGLTPITTYSYSVEAVDRAGNLSGRSVPVFITTQDEVTAVNPPYFAIDPAIISTSDTIAALSFEANKPVNAIIHYGLTPDTLNSIVIEEFLTSHIASITGLEANTLYYIKVTINDFNNNGPVESTIDYFYTAPVADINPPVFLSGPDVTYISSDSAVISWETDEAAKGYLQYGQISADEITITEADYSLNHSILISGLTPDTIYYFIVRTSDIFNVDQTISTEKVFITLQNPDNTRPAITNGPEIRSTTDTRAVIEWTTDKPANSIIKFGTAPGIYDRLLTDTIYDTSHIITLSDLIPSTTYYYRVCSIDPAGNESLESAEKILRTQNRPDTRAPRIGSVISRAGDKQATLIWKTRQEYADSKVVYGTENGIFTQQKYDGNLVTDHELMITNLLPETTYYYQMISKDASGNESVSSTFTFTTTAESAVEPLVITNLTSSDIGGSLLVDWQTNETSKSQLLVRKEDSSSWTIFPHNWFDTSHSYYLRKSQFEPGRYYYMVKNTDQYGQTTEAVMTTDKQPLEFTVESTGR